MARHLITSIRQVGGGFRRVYAATRQAQREARETLRLDPAMIDHLCGVSEIEDVSANGRVERQIK